MRSPLLAGLFDYAGVFPPAELSLAVARDDYDEVVAGDHGWLVGPMLVLASDLGDPLLDGIDPRRLGAVADVVPNRSVTQVEQRVDAASAAAAITTLRETAPVLYLESADPADRSFLEPVATARAIGVDVRPKIRTGGADSAAFPSPSELTDFITACVNRGLPFKATAGLHHPVRVAADAQDATEHGFINMLAATRAALSGDAEATEAALSATDPDGFDLATATFRGVGAAIDPEEVRATFRSIGSCSIGEPAAHLTQLGLL